MPSLDFLRRNWRLLTFGLAMSFASSFGQTFFIGAFGAPLQAEFGLSSGQYGGLYSLATLASALVLAWSGRWIDRMPLARFSSLVLLALAAACWLMASASSVLWLGLAFFALRQAGQGLSSHTSMTSMARYFEAGRGRALSVAAMGFPLGQAFLPALAVVATAAVGWRQTWVLSGLLVALALLPLMRWLLRARGAELAPDPDPAPAPALPAGGSIELPGHAWTRGQALRDPRFWLVLPAAIGPGFILTGVFFHQVFIAGAKGWDMALWTGFFVVFSACQIGASLLAGLLIDRWSARALLPFFLLPMGLGLVLLALAGGNWLAPIFLALVGLTAGLSMTLGGALWAELYGVVHLGAIRSAVSSLGILGTAASPVAMGALIDAGVGLPAIAWGAAGYVIVAILGVLIGLNADAPRPARG